MTLMSRRPTSDMWRVRGMGVADMVRTSTWVRICLMRSLWRTPKRCSSSTTSKPSSAGLGMAAVASLLGEAQGQPSLGLGRPHFAARAKNVIYLFMAGGPSHLDLFDHKPTLRQRHGEDMPPSVLGTQRVTLMTRDQGRFQTAASPFRFVKHGRSGQEMCELMPHLGTCADEMCIIRSIHSEPINHDPAVTFMQTGRPQPGLPCMGSWLSYGLGSENRDLPAFVVMLSGFRDQPIPTRYYHSGFLPAQHQGTFFQASGDP